MTLSSFHRLLEDVIREELLTMGIAYDDVVDEIIPRRDGEIYTVRFRGELHDLDVVEPEALPSRSGLAAQLRRGLDSALRNLD